MQAAAANGAFPYPGLFPPLGQFAPFPRPPLFPPILPPSPPSPGSIRKQDLPPHSFPRPLLPLLSPSSSSPPSLRSPTSDLRESIFQSNQLRAISGQELDIDHDSKVRLIALDKPISPLLFKLSSQFTKMGLSLLTHVTLFLQGSLQDRLKSRGTSLFQVG